MKMFTSETDTVIAESEADANALLCEEYDKTLDELIASGWQVTGERTKAPLTIQDWNDDGKPVTKTPAEWIASEGRCFLCSTEF